MKKTFREITSNINMVLCNGIVNGVDDLELDEWEEFDLYSDLYTEESFNLAKNNWEIEEDKNINSPSDTYKDIYQYYAINWFNWEYISRVTWMPLYYSNKLDLHILWIDFLDNWQNLSYEI